jgi:cellobiose-specific phosphotransferase system component IIB
MILKKAGVTTLSSLRTIILFAADCNYAFKHLGRAMMKKAESQKSIAPEQFGSHKAHKAIDQALNKVLTNDLL